MKTKLKELYRNILRLSPLYFKTKKDIYQITDYESLVKEHIQEAVRTVPFYSNYNHFLTKDFNISDLPIIRKKDIVGKESLLISSKCNKSLLRKVETGGSTGVSLTLYRSLSDTIKDIAFTDFIFSLIGKRLAIAIMRGQKPKNGIYEELSPKKILLSSYSICPENLDLYITILKKYKISCIHAYPSSLSILARLIKSKYGSINLPHLKGILTSSEIFSVDDKNLVRNVFPGIKIIDYYSQNEQTCCAYSVDNGNFIFNPNYGFVEFIETGETKNGNRIAEIVATSIMNKTMPFIRYGTEDFVELDNDNRIISIIGRSSDFVVNKLNNIVPCIVLTRPHTLQNVTNFQYYQDSVGFLHFKVVTTSNFTEKDITDITKDIHSSFNNLMDCSIDIVPFIERTKAGKQKRLIQLLNLNNYK